MNVYEIGKGSIIKVIVQDQKNRKKMRSFKIYNENIDEVFRVLKESAEKHGKTIARDTDIAEIHV